MTRSDGFDRSPWRVHGASVRSFTRAAEWFTRAPKRSPCECRNGVRRSTRRMRRNGDQDCNDVPGGNSGRGWLRLAPRVGGWIRAHGARAGWLRSRQLESEEPAVEAELERRVGPEREARREHRGRSTHSSPSPWNGEGEREGERRWIADHRGTHLSLPLPAAARRGRGTLAVTQRISSHLLSHHLIGLAHSLRSVRTRSIHGASSESRGGSR